MQKPVVEFFQVGPSSLIKHFCDDIDLVNRINQAVAWDPAQWKVSPGNHVLALVINTLCGRLPLSRVCEFYKSQDTEVLFGQGVSAQDFNDDALGRTLDRVFEAGPRDLLTSITLESLMTENEPLVFAHGDTTSKSFYGAYDDPPQEGVIRIERGFNKDYQPDVKQIVMGIVAVNQGTPLFANVCNGNQDDPTWNKDMIDTIAKELTQEQIKKLVYVADSKFFSQDNVRKAQGHHLKFISLVSEQHKLRSEVLTHVLEHPNLIDIGPLSEQKGASEYAIQEVSRSFHGVPLRVVVVYSTHLFQQKQATFRRHLDKEKEQLDKEIQALSKQTFSCETDAHLAWDTWRRKQRKTLFPLDYQVCARTQPVKRTGRGRPKKNEEQKTETVYTLSIHLHAVPEEVLAQCERELGYFVLATDVMDREQLPTVEILREYKQQSTVELRFKFLKDPTFVDALFLKTPERIEALGYLLMLCLFIYMTLERRLRLAVKQQQVRLQPVRGNYTTKPTARQILILLATVTVMKWYDHDDNQWYREVRYEDEVKKVFDLLQFDPGAYTMVRERSVLTQQSP